MKKFDIEKLKRIPILDVAESLGIKVRSLKAECFSGHDKKTPSMSFHKGKNYWNCFGCELGGSTIDLVKNFLGINFVEACQWLEETFRCGANGSRVIVKRKSIKESEQNSILGKDAFQIDSRIYEALLKKCPLKEDGKKFLYQRGFNQNTIEKFGIGQIDQPVKLIKALEKDFSLKELFSCGLMKLTEGTYKPAWWKPMLIFPFFNKDKKIIYIQGRSLDNTPPKYLGLANIKKPIFNSQNIDLWADNETIFICEGIPDVLAADQLGLKAVGILGARGFKKEWVGMFSRFLVKIVPDNDAAGNIFAQSVRNAFEKEGRTVLIERLKFKDDLAEYLLKNR